MMRKHTGQQLNWKLVCDLMVGISNGIDSLRFDLEKCVLVVDFTKFGMVTEGNVHCFIVTILSGPGRLVRGRFLIMPFRYDSFCKGEWKPNIEYYDYYAQSRTDAPVKQVFPYVKTSFLNLHENGI